MSNLVERAFPAKSLMLGFRSIGYSFSTAVADIMDNSISAEATFSKNPVISNPLRMQPIPAHKSIVLIGIILSPYKPILSYRHI